MTVLIVGAGPMAAAHADALSTLNVRFDVLGRGEQSAAKFENEHKIPVIRGGVAALEHNVSSTYEAAIIAVNIESLAPVTIELVKKGITRFLIEKPAGLDATEIRSLNQTLEAAGVKAFVGYNRRFYASTSEVRRLISEDGGLTSFHFEFTEIEDRILSSSKPEKVLKNFTLGNSSHVVDLAFHLGGEPTETYGLIEGSLDWHPHAAVFVGCGKSANGALFSWRADWGSAGRWSLEFRTRRRRLLMEPIETLSTQEKGSFKIVNWELQDEDDKRCKPGVLAQMRDFLSSNTKTSVLPSLADHARSLDTRFLPIFSPKPIVAKQRKRKKFVS